MSMDEMRTSPSPSDDISQHQCSDASSDHSDTSRDGIRSSSPLLPETDPTTVEHPPNMKKKRSLDEMNEQPEDTFASSATIMGDVPSSAVRANAADLPHSNKPSVIAHSMLPPPKPASSASLPYQTTPTSAQVPQSPRSGDNEMGSSTFGQREKAPSPGPHNAPLSDDSQDSSSDPRERMEDFDWNGLHESYHDTTERLNEEEQKVIADFNRLCQFFAVWSAAGSNREIDRSFKRLKTQSTYVQHEEKMLEEKRLHYTAVVKAFQSALDLLQ